MPDEEVIPPQAAAPDSILNSIKKALGVGTDYDPFDAELIMHINSVFATLHQIGCGPQTPFFITSADDVWSSFTSEKNTAQSVKTYVYAKVKLIFDPPPNSFGIKAFEDICKEFEWRLNVQGETP